MFAPSVISTPRTSLSLRACRSRSRIERSGVGSSEVTKNENGGGFSVIGPDRSMYATFGSDSCSFCDCFHCLISSAGEGKVEADAGLVVGLVVGAVVGAAPSMSIAQARKAPKMGNLI